MRNIKKKKKYCNFVNIVDAYRWVSVFIKMNKEYNNEFDSDFKKYF